MTDIQKLKALAQKQINPANWFKPGEKVEGLEFEDLEFIAAANPALVLELITENERITGENQRLRAGVESDLAEIDRIQSVYDAHFRKTRSYRMQRDQANDERDQLKTENTDLHATLQAAKGEIESLKGENERLHSFETACREYSDKTDWVQENAHWSELGMHRADVLRKRCDDAASQIQAQADQLKKLMAQNETLRKLLLEASEEVASWGAYASDYFQEKHDLAGCVARLHDAALSKEAEV